MYYYYVHTEDYMSPISLILLENCPRFQPIANVHFIIAYSMQKTEGEGLGGLVTCTVM